MQDEVPEWKRWEAAQESKEYRYEILIPIRKIIKLFKQLFGGNEK